MNKKAMSSAEYRDSHGIMCPACQSTNVESSQPQMDGSSVEAECNCLNCSATWNDFYVLAGYTNLALL